MLLDFSAMTPTERPRIASIRYANLMLTACEQGRD